MQNESESSVSLLASAVDYVESEVDLQITRSLDEAVTSAVDVQDIDHHLSSEMTEACQSLVFSLSLSD